MTTSRAKIKKHIAAIRREMASFATERHRAACAEMLRTELQAIAGPGPGGAGVAQGAVESKCDCLQPPKQNTQSVPNEQDHPMAWHNLSEEAQDIIREEWRKAVSAPPVLKTDSQCETGPIMNLNNAAPEGVVQTTGLATISQQIVQPSAPEAPLWPAEAELSIVGNVPNPQMMAVRLVGDGRRASLLKMFRAEYRVGQKIRAKLSSKATAGNPVYEAA